MATGRTLYRFHAIALAAEGESGLLKAKLEADPTQAYYQDAAAGCIKLNAPRLKVAVQAHVPPEQTVQSRKLAAEAKRALECTAPERETVKKRQNG